MKHQEFILTFDQTVVQTLGLNQGLNPVHPEFMTLALPHTFIAQRAMLEQNVAYRQLLPYNLVSRQVGNVKEYLVYQRTRQVGEERLGGKYSIGIGGHVDKLDVVADEQSVIDLADTIKIATVRELTEELGFRRAVPLSVGDEQEETFQTAEEMEAMACYRFCIYLGENLKVRGYLIDDSDPVGQVHFGYISELELGEEYEARIAEEELLQIGWMSAEQLKGSSLEFESWSKLLIDQL